MGLVDAARRGAVASVSFSCARCQPVARLTTVNGSNSKSSELQAWVSGGTLQGVRGPLSPLSWTADGLNFGCGKRRALRTRRPPRGCPINPRLAFPERWFDASELVLPGV